MNADFSGQAEPPTNGELMLSSDVVPVLRDGIERQDIDGEAVVWSTISPVPMRLDPVATVLLDVIDGVASVGEIVADVQEVIGLPYDVANQQVARILRSFDDARLLTTSPSNERADEATTRRELFAVPPNP
jgi:hypothetical protein